MAEAIARALDMDAPVEDRLATLADCTRSLAPAAAAAVDRMAERLRLAGAGATSPQPGDLLPPFLLPDEAGHLVALEDLLEKGPVVVAFLRGHWCPFCRVTARALAGAARQIAAAGGSLVAITPERRRYATQLRNEAAMNAPVLSDIDNGYALSLNLAFWVGAEMQKLMTSAGWDVAPSQGSDTWLLPIPATFVVGTDGEVKARFVDPDYRKRMTIEDLLAVLKTAH